MPKAVPRACQRRADSVQRKQLPGDVKGEARDRPAKPERGDLVALYGRTFSEKCIFGRRGEARD